MTTYLKTWEDILTANPFFYLFLGGAHSQLINYIDQIDFCEYTLQVSGALKDQVGTYAKGNEQMKRVLGEAGNMLVENLGVGANVTIAVPLKV